MNRISIVGGGVSGLLLAIQLLRDESSQPIDLSVIDTRPGSVGLAYSTDHDFHLLNVPAYRMSALPDHPDHFVDWLKRATGREPDRNAFYPRRTYRHYIQDTLEETIAIKNQDKKFRMVAGEAVDILPFRRQIVLASGELLACDAVVLALGNPDPAPLHLPDNSYLCQRGYYPSAWSIPHFGEFRRHRKVLILGSGLTMVDAALGLKQAGFSGHIISLSTHGFIPMSHISTVPYEIIDKPWQEINTALEILRVIRKHFRFAVANGIAWQAVIDSVRPYTQQVWHHLPLAEKKRFMDHLRHLWGIARHRMPPYCATQLEEMIGHDRLNIVAGRINSIQKEGGQDFIIEYRPRGQQHLLRIEAASIINCMGPQSDFAKMDHPLIKSLLMKGIIRCDKLHLGLDCTLDGELIGGNGLVSRGFYTIGPPSRGIFWEITSVPDIRNAARSLAKLMTAARSKSYTETNLTS